MAKRQLFQLCFLSAAAVTLAVLPGCQEKGYRGPFRLHVMQVSPSCPTQGSVGNISSGPLFLTPYLERGETKEARLLSTVVGVGHVPSFSGYFTVNKTTGSNMFFWFFPAQNDPLNAPVLLWLQGGPGASSLFALFNELGPIRVNAEGKVEPMPITWNTNYSLIFIDNPVGTGYSFTNHEDGYATNQQRVAEDLYSCLKQFFQVYDMYAANEFYITGESYAGKYVPSISRYIVKMNQQSSFKINFGGMAIGDGLVDPQHMNPAYGPLMRQMSLIDGHQQELIDNMTLVMTMAIEAEQFITALMLLDRLFGIYPPNATSLFYNMTGSTNHFNILLCTSPTSQAYWHPFVVSADTRSAIHVGDLPFHTGDTVEKHLLSDIMDTAWPAFLDVVESGYKVMVYNGQLDIIVGAPLTEMMLSTAPWSGRSKFISAQRAIWKIQPTDKEVAGYIRKVNNLWQVVVRGAGHMVPFDQPERALDIINRFIAA